MIDSIRALLIAAVVVGATCARPLHAGGTMTPTEQTDSGEAPLMAGVLPSDLEPSIEQLVEALGSPVFEERQHATLLLKSLDKSSVEQLKRFYVEQRDHEVRLRLSDIAESLFLRRVLSDLGGFLGIQPMPIDSSDDDRLESGQIAVRIVRVVDHSAAEREGLEVGDLIVEFNGKKLNFPKSDRMGMAKLIRQSPPDAEIQFTIVRGDQLIVKRAVLGLRPMNNILDLEEKSRLDGAWEEYRVWRDEAIRLSKSGSRH